jgi:maltose alpha-D-glucosyltransferase/alpha-amylase
MGRTPFPPIGDLPYLLTLHGHGFYWFRLAKGEEVPLWHEERLLREEPPLLVLFDGWSSFFRDRVVPWRIALAEKVRSQLEEEALPRFIAAQRWYAGKGEAIRRAALSEHAGWREAAGDWLLALFDIESGAGDKSTYFLPLSLIWEDEDENRQRGLLPLTVARVRQQARLGILGDAFGDEAFCRALMEAIVSEREFTCTAGVIRCSHTGAFKDWAGEPGAPLAVRQTSTQASNTAVTLGDRLFLKAYRRLQSGINPEVEIGRFLTEVANFPNTVPLVGTVDYAGKDGTTMALAVLQGYVENQGDGWAYTLNYLERHLELRRAAKTSPEAPTETHGGYLALMRVLGQRTAELHKALARVSGDPAFDPEPIDPPDKAAWVKRIRDEAESTLETLAQRLAALPDAARPDVEGLLARRQEVLQHIEKYASMRVDGIKIRHHGDYHLGQVLLRQNDFMIIDFEGQPVQPLEQRRQKHSPLRDVAGMLRSFNYVAHTALFRQVSDRPEDYAALEPFVRDWEAEVTRAFLEAYETHVHDSGIYSDWRQARALLDLFVLEKAFYELRYELNNRPSWLPIPLRGIVDLVG